jgi:hypothetical protein
MKNTVTTKAIETAEGVFEVMTAYTDARGVAQVETLATFTSSTAKVDAETFINIITSITIGG